MITVHFSAETSLQSDDDDKKFTLRSYQQQSIKVSNGRGLTTYFDPVIAQVNRSMASNNYQILKLKHKDIDLINIYRSKNGRPIQLLESLMSVLDGGRSTIITGDFNLCFMENRGNKIID